MNPKQFLLAGGVVLLLLAILGFVGGTDMGGPIGTSLWLTPGENYAHLVLGIVAIIAAYVLGASARKWLTVVVGLIALYYGVIGFTLPETVPPAYNYGWSANLETLDNLVHLVVAAWAFFAASKKELA